MKSVQVEGHPTLARDIKSKAIIATDTNAYQAFKSKRARIKKDSERLDILEQKITNLENLLQEILKETVRTRAWQSQRPEQNLPNIV